MFRLSSRDVVKSGCEVRTNPEFCKLILYQPYIGRIGSSVI